MGFKRLLLCYFFILRLIPRKRIREGSRIEIHSTTHIQLPIQHHTSNFLAKKCVSSNLKLGGVGKTSASEKGQSGNTHMVGTHNLLS